MEDFRTVWLCVCAWKEGGREVRRVESDAGTGTLSEGRHNNGEGRRNGDGMRWGTEGREEGRSGNVREEREGFS